MTDNDSAPAAEYAVSPVLGLAFLQSALLLSFALEALDFPTYLACHIALCSVAAASGSWWALTSVTTECRADRFATIFQLVAWTALAGPFGTLTAAALFVPHGSGAVPELAQARRPRFSPRELLHIKLLDHRLRLQDAHVVRPLLDVIIEGNRLEKLDALSLISRHYTPALATPLKRALQDKDNSVRVLAATVMARQNDVYTRRIGGLQSKARADSANPQCWRDLGQARIDYADSGLLEASRAKTEVSQADADFARAITDDPSRAQNRKPDPCPCKPQPTSA